MHMKPSFRGAFAKGYGAVQHPVAPKPLGVGGQGAGNVGGGICLRLLAGMLTSRLYLAILRASMTQSFQHVGIIGGGAWGTALAMAMRRAGRDVLVWAHEAEVVDDINRRHENRVFLPEVKLDAKIKATADLSALGGCDALLVVTPAQHTRAIRG